ncbi:hypothetical protein [Gluconobacter thailandicus]|uniref:Uncharacterized protein n=1 Tax=Gluconobacter thailandicus TaxID=257438 RepID=A0AAP9EUB0_GLUTH|nr:hypothetical protein [Gluconobacter thailandicus]QEH97304.1 hypothetical protein FXF46_14380 [Gluconobacter thailandicus]
MTLPWFLNPWAEVRRLRESCFGLNRNWCDALADCQEARDENADLRRRIAEMEEQRGIDQRRTDYIRRTAG